MSYGRRGWLPEVLCELRAVGTDRLPSRLAPQMNAERLMKMAGVVRTGGKGTVRRSGPSMC